MRRLKKKIKSKKGNGRDLKGTNYRKAVEEMGIVKRREKEGKEKKKIKKGKVKTKRKAREGKGKKFKREEK